MKSEVARDKNPISELNFKHCASTLGEEDQ
jgi:hypothetical protein